MIRTVPVAAEMLSLVCAGQPEAVMQWEDVNGRRTLTDRPEVDAETGDPLFTVYAMPSAGTDRPEVLAIRVPARQQPVLTMFAPIACDNLAVNVRVGRDSKLAGYWSASAVRDAGAASGTRKNGAESKNEPVPA